ncbi:peptide chain release factor N(5)-glutamine methyltransferase [Aequorivita sediminis]|uniref:peptide chain release factor N(5)-glutamine methyltransferase n=1 Tax=Aequorivita sediminis TaxID=3073653 RepID=UPI0028AB7FCD|nr:peptide chain release factor N(5)-glutamine methyltransferase [Aequorivita sp. F6058]
MKISKLKKYFHEQLSGFYASEEIQSFFYILSKEYLNLSRVDIALNPETEVSTNDYDKFQIALFKLNNHEPIQYILGETEFYGLPIKVNKYTLIPRPETEELIDYIMSNHKTTTQHSEPTSILDIGTGSGCIAVSLAKNLPNTKVSALDISEKAIQVATENAEINNVNVNFFQTDILKVTSLPEQYDIIVSNPPYVRELEKEMMHENVLRHEPDSALYVTNSDPLLFYRSISRLAKIHLKSGGKLFFEINEYLADEMVALLKDEGFKKIEVKKDIFGKDRMIKCFK